MHVQNVSEVCLICSELARFDSVGCAVELLAEKARKRVQ